MTDSDPLRRVSADDAPDVLAAFRSHPDMSRQGEVSDLAGAQRYIARLTADPNVAFAITADAEAQMLGIVGLDVNPRERSAWFFYWLHADFRGRGLMAASATRVANWALKTGGLERLELGHRANNPSSGAVARAAGFILEGREREKFLIGDERIDVLTYGRVRSDPYPR
jgi:RimJ/RimL family protein N-acetyltransferase